MERVEIAKIINGKRYNTETARPVADYEYSNKSDFGWYAETLYLKQTGEFFLAGEGHADSKYSEYIPEQNASSPSKSIHPITQAEAKEWVEKTQDIEVYEKLFSEDIKREEVEEKTHVNFLMPSWLHEKIKRDAERTGTTITDVIVEQLKENYRYD